MLGETLVLIIKLDVFRVALSSNLANEAVDRLLKFVHAIALNNESTFPNSFAQMMAMTIPFLMKVLQRAS
jgi:hypothetical protein